MSSDKQRSAGLRGHTVICGWNDLGRQIIHELRSGVMEEHRPIVIVTDALEQLPSPLRPSASVTNEAETAADTDDFTEVLVVPGNPASNQALQRASIAAAETAIVLSDPREGEHADARSVLIALAIEAIEPSVHTIVEILKSQNRIHFQHTMVDEIVCIDEFSEKLLAQSALTHGLSEFYTRLLTATADTNEVYLVDVPERLVGKTYSEVADELFEHASEEMILVGLQSRARRVEGERELVNRHGRALSHRILTINPPTDEHLATDTCLCGRGLRSRSYELQAGDRLVVIAYHRPSLD